MNALVVYCRAGFEKDAAEELCQRAEDLGVTRSALAASARGDRRWTSARRREMLLRCAEAMRREVERCGGEEVTGHLGVVRPPRRRPRAEPTGGGGTGSSNGGRTRRGRAGEPRGGRSR